MMADIVALAAKCMLAVMLLAAGGAKLADLAGFAASVRRFTSPRIPGSVARWLAISIAVGEILLGGGSLASPGDGWLNPLVLALTCGFLAVSVVGFAFHRGQPCRCFGALSRRTFEASAKPPGSPSSTPLVVWPERVLASSVEVAVAGRAVAGDVLVDGVADVQGQRDVAVVAFLSEFQRAELGLLVDLLTDTQDGAVGDPAPGTGSAPPRAARHRPRSHQLTHRGTTPGSHLTSHNPRNTPEWPLLLTCLTG